MKKFENPMLQMVSIKNNDIVTASDGQLGVNLNTNHTGTIYAPDRFNEWYEGY